MISLETREILDFGLWILIIALLGCIYMFAINSYFIYILPLLIALGFVVVILIDNNRKGLKMLKEKNKNGEK